MQPKDESHLSLFGASPGEQLSNYINIKSRYTPNPLNEAVVDYWMSQQHCRID